MNPNIEEFERRANAIRQVAETIALTMRDLPPDAINEPILFAIDIRHDVASALLDQGRHARGMIAGTTFPHMPTNWTDNSKIRTVIPDGVRPLDHCVAMNDIDELVYGNTVYPLIKRTREIFADGLYSLEGLSEYIKGRGETIEDARRQFLQLLHEEFQSIKRTWPSFRTERQTKEWEVLSAFVDVPLYEEKRPDVYPHEVGQVLISNNVGTRTVRWRNETTEEIPLELAPPEFAAFGNGRWFEAFLERQRSTCKLLKIGFVISLARPPIYSEAERNQFWNQPETQVEVKS